MLRKWIGIGLLAATAFASSAQATPVSINVDGSWNVFDVDDFTSASGGLEWIDIVDGAELSFSFTTTTDAWLTVVDAGFAGDTFRIFDNGIQIGVTGPATENYPVSIGLDFDAALASGNYSYGMYLLAAGDHVISGELLDSAHAAGIALNATVGGLNVAPVPLPGGLLLLLSGGGLLGAIRRRGGARLEVRS
jgi:hypothetical protein